MHKTYLKKIKSTFTKSNSEQQIGGIACLASLIKYYGGSADTSTLINNSGANVNGANMLGLCKAAIKEDFDADGYKGDINLLKELEQPAILHIEKDSGDDDFILVYCWDHNKFIIGDPYWGIIEFRENELEAVWKSKVFIYMEPSKSFKTGKEKLRLKKDWLRDIINREKSQLIMITIFRFIGAAMLFILLLTIMIQTGNILSDSTGESKISFVTWILTPLIIFSGSIVITRSIKRQGVAGFTSRMHKKRVKTVFRNIEETNTVQSLIEVTATFSKGIFQLCYTLPFTFPIFMASLVLVCTYSIMTGMVLLLASVCIAWLIWRRMQDYAQLTLLGYQSEDEIMKTLLESIRSYKQAILTNSDVIFNGAIHKALTTTERTKLKLTQTEGRLDNWFYIICFLCFLSIFIMFYYSNTIHEINYWVALIAWSVLCMWAIKNLFQHTLIFTKTKVAFNFLYKHIGLYKSTGKEEDAGEKEQTTIKSISLKKVSFAFAGSLPVFADLDICATLGKLNVIYGSSGTGKSVLVSILGRLLPVLSGEITVNGNAWKLYNNNEWRNNISFVPQPLHVFNTTALQNIGWGQNISDPDKIISFCAAKGFDQFIKEFPNGYRTHANKLSIGQKQLVAVAAALYREPKILVLDEPLALMDDEMGNFCWGLLQQLKNSMLIIFLTANRSLAENADHAISIRSEDPISVKSKMIIN